MSLTEDTADALGLRVVATLSGGLFGATLVSDAAYIMKSLDGVFDPPAN